MVAWRLMGSALGYRALLKRAFRWGLRTKPGLHSPDFDDAALLRALTGPNSRVDVASSTTDALASARRLFGSRFFIAPESVASLWQRAATDFPEWREQQIQAIQCDIEAGVPVYNLRGPRLGGDFPWPQLPPGPGGDRMYSTRPHRFAFAPRHGLACHHDTGASGRLYGMLQGWAECAQQGRSPHCYDSNLAVIQRLLALSWCWAFVAGRGRDATDEEFALEWLLLRTIRADIRFLEPRLGHSAPNNHLLADRFAAWYLHTVFPELLAESGNGDAEAEWRDELLRQTYPDGGSFEHSTHYHEFACEMGAAYLLLCRRQGRTPDRCIETRVEALLHFQAALTGPEAEPLPIGNGIEDTLFPLDPDEGWCPGSLRELYRALFRPEIPAVPSDNRSCIRAFWLLGGASPRSWSPRGSGANRCTSPNRVSTS